MPSTLHVSIQFSPQSTIQVCVNPNGLPKVYHVQANQFFPLHFTASHTRNTLYQMLKPLSEKQRQQFFQTFFLRMTQSACGKTSFILQERPRLLGGGLCHSKGVSVVKGNAVFAAPAAPNSPLIPREQLFPFESTLHVASALKQIPSNSPGYPKVLALEIINCYANRGHKNKAVIEEISLLAFGEHPEVSRSLIQVLMEQIRDNPFLDISVLTALRRALYFAPIEALDQDDLVQTLSILFKRFQKLHQQDKTSIKTFQALKLLSQVLDTMGDAGVFGLDRLDLHDPCYDILNKLISHSNPLLSSEASYAQQALVRIPNNETNFGASLRRVFGVFKGVASLATAVRGQDPEKIIDAYVHFKAALKHQNNPHPWYDQMRLVRLLVELGQFPSFEKFLFTDCPCTQEFPFAAGVLSLLATTATEHPDPLIQKSSLAFLQEMFLDRAVWPKKLQGAIVTQLEMFVSHPTLSVTALEILQNLQAQQLTQSEQQMLRKIDVKSAFPPLQRKLSLLQFQDLKLLFSVAKASLPSDIHKDRIIPIQIRAPHPDFVGREDLLKALSEIIPDHYDPKAPSSIKILVGPGGLGKSEVAITFADINREAFSLIWFFHTESQELCDQDYRELAAALNIFIEKQSSEEIRKLVHRRLEQGMGDKPWLLVFDNVEKSLPLPERGGCLLLTTRYHEVHPDKRAFLDVRPFSVEDAVALATKIQDDPVPMEDLIALHGTLQGWSMLVNLALHYIADTNCSVKDYLERISTGFALNESTERYPRSLGQVVQISSLHLLEKNPLAHQFFSLVVHLNPDHIPLFLLDLWLAKQKIDHVSEERRKIIKALVDSSLVYLTSDKTCLTVHRLTQLVCSKQEQAQENFNETIKLLAEGCRSFNKDDPKSWKNGEEAAFQIETIPHNPFWLSVDGALKGEIFSIAGIWLTFVSGDAKKGLECIREALKIYEALGNESQVAASHSVIGTCLDNLGHPQDALESQQKALATRLKVYGDEHPAVAMSYSEIGSCLKSLGRPQEALESQQKALAIRLKVCEGDHPDLAMSYANIGHCLSTLGRPQEALESQQKALAIRLKVYGEEHPTVAKSYGQIGNCLNDLGHAQEALESMQKGLRIEQNIYGDVHPILAISHVNIGNCLFSLGRYQEALEFHQKALWIQLKVYGDEHPAVAMSYTNIGNCLKILDRPEEALQSQQKALDIKLKVHGEEHPAVAISYNNIGNCLESLGRFQETLDCQEKALAIFSKVYGNDHPHMAMSYTNRGKSLQGLGRLQEALESHQKALAVRLKVYGDDHPDVARSYTSIGHCLTRLDRAEESLEYERKALAIFVKFYGDQHPSVATCYSNIGIHLENSKQYPEAIDQYRKALEIRQKLFGENHPAVTECQTNINDCLKALGSASK